MYIYYSFYMHIIIVYTVNSWLDLGVFKEGMTYHIMEVFGFSHITSIHGLTPMVITYEDFMENVNPLGSWEVSFHLLISHTISMGGCILYVECAPCAPIIRQRNS